MDTFENLCEWTASNLKKNPSILYELTPEKRSIVSEYNLLGFLTVTSQPGSICRNVLYKTAYHRNNNCDDQIIGFCLRKQRAFIRGYMKTNLAQYVFSRLREDPHLFVRTAQNNLTNPFEIKFGSVNFVDDIPVQKEEPIEFNEYGPDAHWSFNLNLPLRKPFSLLFGTDYPLIDSSDLVEVEIVESRWNENSYFWTTLLQVLQDY